MDRRWIVRTQREPDLERALERELDMARPLAGALARRGCRSVAEGEAFLHPSLNQLHDPFELRGMERATDRLVAALRADEQLLVHGDCDVDGLTGTALLCLALGDVGARTDYFIPDRFREGYGLRRTGLEVASARRATLLITVDCGIAAVDAVDAARDRGIDVIVVDHHAPQEILPSAVAVLDPEIPGSGYPFTGLAAVGVAFKLAQALYRKLAHHEDELLQHLDLVALGTIADVVPLTDENRVLVSVGLQILSATRKSGLVALLETAGQSQPTLTSRDVRTAIAPRINAAARLSEPCLAVELFVTRDDARAFEIAERLDQENERRRVMAYALLTEVMEKIKQDVDLSSEKVIVLAGEDWHTGLLGYVAARVTERFHRPVVLIGIEEGIGRGSARSIAGYDISRALESSRRHLLAFGGHTRAAGLTIDAAEIDTLREQLNEMASVVLSEDDLIPSLEIDDEVALGEVDLELVRQIDLFAPFGYQNPRPRFVARGLKLVGSPRTFGKSHLRFKVRSGNRVVQSVGFGLGDMAGAMGQGEPVLDLVFVPCETGRGGKKRLELRAEDMRFRGKSI
ncbi:hypothetical protein AMJ39_02945 [candidate division TA06 bacterium DG_24]|uniref:Single-stranded-DNA-specific exonuclease RecJ n=1 Tax=candidate division TA06 bacterium DG_24 TaxID=1703770 RepID=A0A0S7WUN7_UNCT6|nr:MAG: hypothetical protein AMJ39_02945 [candidate division TA06 bacterium DG_24]